VVTAVAKAADTDPVELPPLYEYIDPDALDKLVGDATRFEGYITFDYDGYSVTTYADGEIVVHQIDGP